ncbi:hypothetical protein DMH25_08360 [Streptomyces sp. WAC 01325]|uniref:hypothetical protein n=1 Tax=Streptomyces TaxID=1883 RepID=UPI000F879CC9|nr:hypothetical protein [Streptomyces sp. WAC 01325]RSN13790.1 hypothetical protein DMH25_08360 [Streptomyces sp. WAC 01325]
MSLAVTHTLYCDRAGCRAELQLKNTGTASAAKTVAYRDHGWSTRRGDYCPAHNPRRKGGGS